MAAQNKTLWIGDKWQIGVKYRNTDGTPFTFNADRTPAGRMYLGATTNDPLDFTVGNGRCLVLDQTNPDTKGTVVFQLHQSQYTPSWFKTSKPQYNRLQTLLVDQAGEESTQAVVTLDIRDPHIGDIVTGVSFSSEVVTVTGTLGSSGQTILSHPLTAASSYAFAHGFDYQPQVWAVNDNNEPVEVDYEYVSSSVVAFTFPVPFTGILYLA